MGHLFLYAGIGYLTTLSLIYLGLKWSIAVNEGIHEEDFDFVTKGMWIPFWQIIILVGVYSFTIVDWRKVQKLKRKNKNGFHEKLFNVTRDGDAVIPKTKETKKEIEKIRG